MKFFVLTQRAEQDISDIWDYIADDNIEAIPNPPASLPGSPAVLLFLGARSRPFCGSVLTRVRMAK